MIVSHSGNAAPARMFRDKREAHMNPIRSAILLVACLALVSCGGSSSSCGPSSAITALYLMSANAPVSILAYDSPGTADGAVAPDRDITGANTLLFGVYDGAYDVNTDTLYVADLNTDSVLIWDGVSLTNGNVAPSRVISGAATGLNGPEGVALDKKRDLLYVTSRSAVLVYSGATTADGNLAPSRTITGASTNFSGGADMRLAVDEGRDLLFVSDPGNSSPSPSIFVFSKASMRDGNVAPTRTIVGANTTFRFPWGISLDVKNNILYVADEGTGPNDGSIEVFTNAGRANGNIAPAHVIAGPTSTINRVAGVYVDPVTDTLYATDVGNFVVLAWDNASTVNGDIAPARTIDGGFTGFLGGLVGAQ
jgi:hypothetical protein